MAELREPDFAPRKWAGKPDFAPLMDGQANLVEGQEIEIGLSADSMHLFDSETEERL